MPNLQESQDEWHLWQVAFQFPMMKQKLTWNNQMNSDYTSAIFRVTCLLCEKHCWLLKAQCEADWNFYYNTIKNDEPYMVNFLFTVISFTCIPYLSIAGMSVHICLSAYDSVRQTVKWSVIQTVSQTESQSDRHNQTVRQSERQSNSQAVSWTDSQTVRQSVRHTHRQTNRQTDS